MEARGKTKSIHRQILDLSWPAIATNITTPLLSLADVAIVGHLEKPNLIGAVAVGGTVFNILYWLFAFLRMGTSGMTAQAYGAGDRGAQRDSLFRGALIAVAGSLVVLVLAQSVGRDIIDLVDAGGDTAADAWLYFRLTVIGAPGVLLTYVFSGWLLGMQRSRPIMWIALATNILNIALSLGLVYGLGMGIVGVALGTAVSQLAGAAIGLFVVLGVYRRECRTSEPGRALSRLSRLKDWKPMFSVNGDIFLRTVCLASVTLWFTHAGASIGNDVLSANALLMQLFLIFSYFMDGFAFGGEALAGKYYGAGDRVALHSTVKALFAWGTVTSLIFTLLYFVAGDTFLRLLTHDESTVRTAREYVAWSVTVPLMSFAAFTWDGILIGLTKTRYLLLSMAAAMAVFFGMFLIGRRYVAPTAMNHLLWCAFVIYLAVRGAVATLLYRRFIRSLT